MELRGTRMHVDQSDDDRKKQEALNRAFILAASNGCTDILRALLDVGVDVHAKAGQRALDEAALNGRTEAALLLMEAGVFLWPDCGVGAPWRLAASNGHKDTARAIIDWQDKHPPGTEKGSQPAQP
jgi:Ankyrin repeats (3 copies)